MAESIYTIPGMEITLDDGNFGQDLATDAGNGILLIGPSDTNSTAYTFTPVSIKSQSAFGSNSVIGTYNVRNALARGYKQLKDTCSNPISAISLPKDCIVGLDDNTDLSTTRVKAFLYLNELLNVIKDNSYYERTVLKNLYDEVYSFDAHAITLDFLMEIGAVQKDGNGDVEYVDLSTLTTTHTLTESNTEVALPDWFYNKWLAVLPGDNVENGYLSCKGITPADKDGNGIIVDYSFIRFNKPGDTVTSIEVLSPKTESQVFLNLKKKDGSTGMFISSAQGIEFSGVKTWADLADATPIGSIEFRIDALLAQFCLETTLSNACMIGFMSVRPPENDDLVNTRKWVASQKQQLLNGYVQKCATLKAAFFLGNLAYYDTIEAAYAGTDAALPANSSTTNKTIRGLQGTSRLLSASQISKLSFNNLVTLRSRNGSYYIADGVTTAGTASDFTRLTTVKITNSIIKAVRDVAEPYIGEPNTIERRNALNDQIEEILDLLKTDGMIQAFKSQVLATDRDVLDGNLQIALSIVPVFELRRINLVIALKPSL